MRRGRQQHSNTVCSVVASLSSAHLSEWIQWQAPAEARQNACYTSRATLSQKGLISLAEQNVHCCCWDNISTMQLSTQTWNVDHKKQHVQGVWCYDNA